MSYYSLSGSVHKKKNGGGGQGYAKKFYDTKFLFIDRVHAEISRGD